jgi:hypothetical protein
VDWGVNEINIDAPNTWRTLSKDEWEYLINKRSRASQLYGAACVNGVNGVMFMPDDWVSPDGVIFVSGMATKKGSEYYKTQNSYSLDQWAVLENSGVVFLPAAGRRIKDPVNINEYGNYWSNSIKDDHHFHYLAYASDQIYVDAIQFLSYGRSVRLVQDVQNMVWYTDEAVENNGRSVSNTGTSGWAYLKTPGNEDQELNRRYQNKRINCIRLRVAKAGTFTIGVVDRNDLNTILHSHVVTLNNVPFGDVQTIVLPETIHLQANQVLFFGARTDTGKFCFFAGKWLLIANLTTCERSEWLNGGKDSIGMDG